MVKGDKKVKRVESKVKEIGGISCREREKSLHSKRTAGGSYRNVGQ